MVRVLLKFSGLVLLLAGFAVGLLDGTRLLASASAGLTPLGQVAFWLFPRQFPILEPAVTRHIHPWLWDPVLLNLFLLPSVLVFFALGTGLLILARRRASEPAITER